MKKLFIIEAFFETNEMKTFVKLISGRMSIAFYDLI